MAPRDAHTVPIFAHDESGWLVSLSEVAFLNIDFDILGNVVYPSNQMLVSCPISL